MTEKQLFESPIVNSFQFRSNPITLFGWYTVNWDGFVTLLHSLLRYWHKGALVFQVRCVLI